ncbi:hypothetical protein CK203_009792 [Vitis vinifera]|uniref:GAG-pre-integrase domain-containing protein n=1 Tax=Vitis vinifera TaxID=29760 RepID=A0A438JV37_VITVI|nr:hypothetical protein CK203_009792 [Vitis vinifera]
MGQGYEDHLVTQEANIPEAYKTSFKFWNQAKGLYTNDIQRLYKVASSIVNVRQEDILGSSSVPSLDDVFVRLLHISSTQTLLSDNTSDSSVLVSQTNSQGGRSGDRGRGQRLHCTYCNKLGHTRDRCYQLHGRPPRIAHVAQSSDPQPPQPPSSSTSQGISLIDNSGASDHISGNKDLFSSITTTSALPTVTLANGSQTMAKGPEYGEDHWHRTRLGHPSLSKFQKMVLRFSSLSSLACESCQLGKHTRVSFPKRLHNRAKSPFELVHTNVWGPCQTALQKGYHCYSFETHRYFLSADVTFFEDSPFFSTFKSLSVSEVLPLPIISPPDAVPSRPLQVYHRRHRVVVPPSLAEVPADSLPIPSASPTPALPPSADLSIALQKGNPFTRNPHPIYNFLSYHRLSSPYSAFVSAISFVSLPKSTPEAHLRQPSRFAYCIQSSLP